MLNRRQFLIGSAAVASLSTLAGGCGNPWNKTAYRKPQQSPVAILQASDYSTPLTEIIQRGVNLCGLRPKGKRVVLKPNMVEFDPNGVINTHPAVIAATIEAFRSLGAREVIVAEGPGHRRDTEYLLLASGLYAVLKEHKAPFTDLNLDDVQVVRLNSQYTDLGQLYLPETILNADLLVSMPKMKTHHWVGVTLSLKNMFGLVPGAVYGWPKNVLHWAGISSSILDINSSLPIPQFAIVDVSFGMEGNGPIQCEPKPSGVMVFGRDMIAVDATASRLMSINPKHISYLAEAGKFLGNIGEDDILQVGENIDRLRKDFRVLPSFQYVKKFNI